MTIVPPRTGAKVLVTGANGYIALHVVDQLLKAGYVVRGTVRSQSKVAHLTKTFASYGDKFECIVVEDITKDGAFDEVVKDVDAIEHTASPFHTKFDDPQEAIGPAVQGTTSVLKSVLKYGTRVKRVVVTSSCAAILQITAEPKVYSEKDWNTQAPAEVEAKGRAAEPMQKYRASKMLAERAAWDLWNANKDKIQWELVTLNPPFVFGPVLHEVSDPNALNTSMLDWWNTVVKGTKDEKFLQTFSGAWIDVRDLGVAHTLALSVPEAGGERIIISAGSFKWQDWLDTANGLSPAPYPELSLAKGVPGSGSAKPGTVHNIAYDTTKAARVLGLGTKEHPYTTVEETTRANLEDFKARGWK